MSTISKKCVLIISKDYWGTSRSETVANRFANELSKVLQINDYNIEYLLGSEVRLNNVKDRIYKFVNNALLNNQDECVLYIYMNGHGNQTADYNGDEIDNCDELYQLEDGNLIDDELTSIIDSAVHNSNAIRRPLICLISDHCSSGSMIDNTQSYFDWVSIGSSLDNQDSYVDGDGNVMTNCLITILQKQDIRELKAIEIYELLEKEMKGSFIGDLQKPTFHFSGHDIENKHIFKN